MSLLWYSPLLDEMASQIPHGCVLAGEPREHLALPPLRVPDGVAQQRDGSGRGAVSDERRDLHARQLPQPLTMVVLGDLDEHLRLRVGRQLFQQSADRGKRGVLACNEEPGRVVGERLG